MEKPILDQSSQWCDSSAILSMQRSPNVNLLRLLDLFPVSTTDGNVPHIFLSRY